MTNTVMQCHDIDDENKDEQRIKIKLIDDENKDNINLNFQKKEKILKI